MKKIERDLAVCLDDIKASKATFEECLERNPVTREELGDLLRLAEVVGNLPEVVPSASFKARAKASTMQYAHEHPTRPSRWPALKMFAVPAWARAAAIVLAVIVVLAGAVTGTAFAAESSLPGDVLYPVKTGIESWRAWAETDATADAGLQLEFAGRRVEEMRRLAEKSSDISIVVPGYAKNLENALLYGAATGSPAPLEDITLALAGQLQALDSIEDIGAPPGGFYDMVQIAVTWQIEAIRRLSETSPVRAAEMNIEAMRDRLGRTAAASAAGNTAQAENALRQWIRYAGLGEEMEERFAGTGTAPAIESLYSQAVREQQRLFAPFWGVVPAELAGKVQMAFQRIERNRGEAPGGNQGEAPGGNQGEAPGGNQGEAPGDNQGEAPGDNQGEAPGGTQGEAPGGNQGEAPGGNPGEAPGGNPGEAPGGNQGEAPGGNQGEAPGGTQDEAPGGNQGEAPGGPQGK